MKRIICLSLCLAMCFILCACGGSGSGIVGKWADVNDDENVMEFKSNGDLIIYEDGEKEDTGSYKIDGDSITLTIDGETIPCDFEIKGNKLTFSMEGMTFLTHERK